MKTLKLFLLPVLILICIISNQAEAQEKPYTEGSVWEISLIKTKMPFFNDYMKNLSNGWKKVMDEAKKQGLIVSYMVLSSMPRNPQDWDLALMIEYKNMAALDGLSEKMENISGKLFGGQQEVQNASVKRNDLREILGNKMARQLLFK